LEIVGRESTERKVRKVKWKKETTITMANLTLTTGMTKGDVY